MSIKYADDINLLNNKIENLADGTADTDAVNLSQLNAKVTDGSVTKIGTATVGSTTNPVYLNAGVPTAIGGDVAKIGDTSNEYDHYINRRFVPLDASTQYWILCENTGYNDVNGSIRLDRTSGNYAAGHIDVVISSSTTAMIGGSLTAHLLTQNNERYSLVTITYNSISYVAIKYIGNTYPSTVGAFFTGRLVSTGISLVPVAAADISDEVDIGGATKYNFNTDTVSINENPIPYTSSGTEGSATQPVYVNNNVITAITGTIDNNAATATKLATARTISLTGDVTGSGSFDGSANLAITATVVDDSHNHVISNVDNLQTALDAKADLVDLTDGSVTKVGTATVGSSVIPMYLSSGTPTASTSTVGSSTQPVYLNAGTITAITGTINNNAATATKLATARTITVDGAVNGSASFDGSGNITITTDSNVVLKNYTIDASALSTDNFYPVTFPQTVNIIDCEIHSPSLSGTASYNQNVIKYQINASGYSDTPIQLVISHYKLYQTAEVAIGCIGYGTQNGYVTCVWIRGGMSYTFNSNYLPTLHTTDYTYGTSVFSVGTNYYGGDTNAYIGILFTPQATMIRGAYFSDGITCAAFIGNASTATTLATARTLSLTGDVTGSGSFNGSADLAITATVADDSHNHVISNVDNLQTALDAKADLVDLTDGSVTKVGTATVGSSTKPIYLSSGTPTASTSTVGSSTQPVYMSSGTVTASTSTVGASTKPVYLNAGTITASTSTIGSATQPVYMSSGTVTASTSTVGSSSQPVYMNAGTVTAITGTIANNAATATTLATARTISLTGDVTGSGSFNGSADLAITATVTDNSHNHNEMYRVDISGLTLDLDTLNHASESKTAYYIEKTDGGSANITNTPNALNRPFILDVESIRYASSADYLTKQIFTQSNTGTGKTYYRWCRNGTWSQWYEQYSSEFIDTTPTSGSTNPVTSGGVYNALTTGSVTKVGTATVGSGVIPMYLSSGTPTASTSTVGSATQPVYMNAGTVTAITGTIANNAATATTLATARTISLSGDVTGSGSFDGSANLAITATVADDSHNHIIDNIDDLQTTLDAKQGKIYTATTTTAAATAAKTITVTGWTPTAGDLLMLTYSLGSTATAITLSVNSGTAYNIRLNSANTNTTTFTITAGGSTLLYFDGTYWQATGSQRTGDSDTYDRVRVGGYLQVGPTTRYKLMARSTNNIFYPLTIGDNTTTGNTAATTSFVIGSNILWYYSSTTLTAAATSVNTMYTAISLGYAQYNFNSTAGITTAPVYLKAINNGDGTWSMHSDMVVQSLPTTEDGYIYVMIGFMSNTTTTLTLFDNNIYYEYKNGAIREYTPEIAIEDVTNLQSELDSITGSINTSAQHVRTFAGDYWGKMLTLYNVPAYTSIIFKLHTKAGAAILQLTSGTASNVMGNVIVSNGNIKPSTLDVRFADGDAEYAIYVYGTTGTSASISVLSKIDDMIYQWGDITTGSSVTSDERSTFYPSVPLQYLLSSYLDSQQKIERQGTAAGCLGIGVYGDNTPRINFLSNGQLNLSYDGTTTNSTIQPDALRHALSDGAFQSCYGNDSTGSWELGIFLEIGLNLSTENINDKCERFELRMMGSTSVSNEAIMEVSFMFKNQNGSISIQTVIDRKTGLSDTVMPIYYGLVSNLTDPTNSSVRFATRLAPYASIKVRRIYPTVWGGSYDLFNVYSNIETITSEDLQNAWYLAEDHTPVIYYSTKSASTAYTITHERLLKVTTVTGGVALPIAAHAKGNNDITIYNMTSLQLYMNPNGSTVNNVDTSMGYFYLPPYSETKCKYYSGEWYIYATPYAESTQIFSGTGTATIGAYKNVYVTSTGGVILSLPNAAAITFTKSVEITMADGGNNSINGNGHTIITRNGTQYTGNMPLGGSLSYYVKFVFDGTYWRLTDHNGSAL